MTVIVTITSRTGSDNEEVYEDFIAHTDEANVSDKTLAASIKSLVQMQFDTDD